jgi:hypothetical protein
MAAFLVVAIVITVLTGVVLGAFLNLSWAIVSEDRRKWSLRFDAPTASTRAARRFVGIGTK